MQAALVTGRHEIELTEFPDPEPSAGKPVVQIASCGICGTDLHAYHTGDPYNPAICGHEWTGTVSAVPSDVLHVKEGDRVAIGVQPACGQCNECKAGDPAHCVAVMMGMIGIGPLAAPHGGFAPAIAIDGKRLYTVRDGLSDVEASMLEPSSIAIHALRRTPLRLGDAVLVIGAGPVGLLVQQCAKAAGAGIVVVIEPNAARAALSKQLGAEAVIDPTSEDVTTRVAELCGPLGPDVVFECAGIPQTVDQSVKLARRGGVVSLVGMATVPAEISPGDWLIKEVRLVASLGQLHDEFDTAMQLVADGRLKLEPLHTKTVKLSQIDQGFQDLLAGGDQIKILVDPRE